VRFVVPTKGFSSLSVEGGVLHDPASDNAFIDELIKNLDPQIETIQVDTHINTEEFALTIVEALEESFKHRADTQ
jgi:uncharacterized protein (UPF0261 family)